MKLTVVIIALLLCFFSAQFLQGCDSKSKVYQVIVEFQKPVEASKGATKTLWIYYIIPSGDNTTCQDLMSGARKPGDNGYQVEYTEGIPNPFTKKVPALRVEDTITRLFFLEGEDAEDQTILRGCNTSGSGAQDITITLAIVCPSAEVDCDGDFSTGCETDLSSPGVCNGHAIGCSFSGGAMSCICSPDYSGANCDQCAVGSLGTYPNCTTCDHGYLGIFPDCFLPSSLNYCLTSECFAIPPTGQTTCYDDSGPQACSNFGSPPNCSLDYCGQDPQYPKSRTFTCISLVGQCGPSASDGEVVTDSVTGLMWQRMIAPARKNWSDAKKYCEQDLNGGAGYGGHADWRLPNPIELHSILDISKTGSSLSDSRIDTSFFPSTPVDYLFWTSSEDTVTTTNAFAVGFGDYAGDTGRVETKTIDKNTVYYVRCVRAGPIITATGGGGRFNEEGSPTVVTDRITGLMWIKPQSSEVTCSGSPDYTCSQYPCRCSWLGALKNCENSSYATYSDWRLPNKNELISLLNYSATNYYSDFQGYSGNNKFWSSSCSPGTSDSSGHPFAWWVNFKGGLVGNDYQSSTYLFLCVR